MGVRRFYSDPFSDLKWNQLSTCEDDYIEIAWIYQLSIIKADRVVRMGCL